VAVDVTPLAGVLVDLPRGRRGLRREQRGIDAVLTELADGAEALASVLEFEPSLYGQVVEYTDRLAQLRAARSIVARLAEALEETEIQCEHDREAALGRIADRVKSVARLQDRSILATFEKTVAYNAQVGVRAVKTRRQKAAKAEQAAQAQVADTPAQRATAT
jgi:hypothetical protein